MYGEETQDCNDQKVLLEIFAKEVQIILHTTSENEYEAAACKLKKPHANFQKDKGVYVTSPCLVMGIFADKKTALIRTNSREDLQKCLRQYPSTKCVIVLGVGYSFSPKFKLGDVLVIEEVYKFITLLI